MEKEGVNVFIEGTNGEANILYRTMNVSQYSPEKKTIHTSLNGLVEWVEKNSDRINKIQEEHGLSMVEYGLDFIEYCRAIHGVPSNDRTYNVLPHLNVRAETKISSELEFVRSLNRTKVPMSVMASHMRQHKFYFVSNEEWSDLIQYLNNFTARIRKEVRDMNDEQGGAFENKVGAILENFESKKVGIKCFFGRKFTVREFELIADVSGEEFLVGLRNYNLEADIKEFQMKEIESTIEEIKKLIPLVPMMSQY